MPPKASTVAGSGAGGAGTGGARRKRPRTRQRRGGRGRKGAGAQLNLSSSDEDDDSSDEDEAKKPTPVVVNGKGKGKAKESASSSSSSSSSSSDSEDDDEPAEKSTPGKKVASGKAVAATPATAAEADSDGESSASSSSGSSSSSFLTSSEEESDDDAAAAAAADHVGAQQINGFGMDHDGPSAPASTRRTRQPSPGRAPSPPYLSFGPDALTTTNISSIPGRVTGKPILYGLLPQDATPDSAAARSAAEREEEERNRLVAEKEYQMFREHYVSRLIERFGSSLDEIRVKEAKDLKESRLQVLIASIADGADTFDTASKGRSQTRSERQIWAPRRDRRRIGEREMALEALRQVESHTTNGSDEDESAPAEEDGGMDTD